jgi:hypothetical protein
MNTELLQDVDIHCPLCGEPLAPNATECTRPDWVQGYREFQEHLPERDPRNIAAPALSLFMPGVGHYFKGYVLAAWLLLVLGVPVILVFAFAFTMFFGWLLAPAYWIAVADDAYFRRDLRLVPVAPHR